MGCGNSPALDTPMGKNGLDWIAKTSEASHDGQTTHGDGIFGSDLMSFPSPDYDYFPWSDIGETFNSYTREYDNEKKSLGGYVNLNDLAETNTDANWTGVKLKESSCHRESEMLSCRELSHKNDDNKTVTENCLMNAIVSSTGYGKGHWIPGRGETAAGYPVKAHSSISGLHIGDYFSSSGCSTSMSSHADNIDGKGLKSGTNIVLPQFGSPGKGDGSFLTLGIGDGTEISSKSNFSTREIASKLEEAVSPHCDYSLVGYSPNSTSSFNILTGRAKRTQTYAGEIPSAECNFATKMSSCTGGFVSDTSSQVNSDPFRTMKYPQITLGNEISSKSNFGTHEVATKMEEAISSHCENSLVGYNPNNTSSYNQLTGSPKRTQTCAGELPSSASNFVSRIFTCTGGLVSDTSAQLNSFSFPTLHYPQPQADIQTNFSAKYDTFCFDPTPSSLPFGSHAISHPGHVNSSQLGSDPIKLTYFENQVIPNQQKDTCRRGTTDVSSESSMNLLSDGHRRISNVHAQLGNPTLQTEGSKTDVTRIGSLPSSVQPVGRLYSSHNVTSAEDLGNILLPERIRFQVPKFPSAVDGPFPKRLGVQSNDSATHQNIAGNLHQTQHCGAVDYFQMPGPPFVGPSPIHMPAPLRTSVSDLDRQKLMQQFSKDIQSFKSSHGQVPVANLDQRGQVTSVANLDQRTQTTPVINDQPLKRQATGNPLGAQLGQRRKISAPFPATADINSAPFHIKWQGFDRPPQPSGHKCLLCKRDLLFTAEGPVFQPDIPPPVAVLPCGHTFHDHCLQIIIPQDQSENPPCIPCAIGET